MLPKLALALLTLSLTIAPAASGATSFERIKGFNEPATPAKYDKVGILKVGKAKAKNVLILNPGTSASAAYFHPLMETIVAELPSWQVWAVERRENLLEDHSVANQAKTGAADAQRMFDYYLGHITDQSVTDHFTFLDNAELQFAKQWGMNTEIQDLHRVVKRAKKGGRNVVLGGHSLGGTITTAYATWDFNGKPGAKGLSGLVFIDGGSGPDSATRKEAKKLLSDLEDNPSPWLEFGGIAAPFAGLFNIVGAQLVKLEPQAPSRFRDWEPLPDDLVPPMPTTTEASYGFALDTETSPDGLVAAQAHLGKIAAEGEPRPWDPAGELTPIQRYADMFSGTGLENLDGTAWYHPLRLTIDGRVVAAGNKNKAQKVMDVHAIHGKNLPRDLRIYAFAASLGGKRVIDAAKALAKQSRIPKKQLTLLNRASTYAHNDPNSAFPKNDFVEGLLPYLEQQAR
jgi:pimeloyl-ACP methyl ester carboxylesterase